MKDDQNMNIKEKGIIADSERKENKKVSFDENTKNYDGKAKVEKNENMTITRTYADVVKHVDEQAKKSKEKEIDDMRECEGN
mmetsp:Transcript_39452/g.57958  ORF Transcript_39452/g.57958 Transcript_39452/m.57958 type:complete len:82 (-) Transcript_39452:13-258(-)